ncbi:hypothetical protein V491_00392 [Pseudogymnoascus sp. VKM F-3775]|nr:hypothetical protein V491_00392 [Pseudogymnoascus sp. VKM F-3775]
MSLIYKIHRIPTDDPMLSAFLSGKLAALRLQALTLSQSAFGGKFVFEIFARMPHTKWVERLRRPNFHTFVAIAYPEGTAEEEQTIDTGDIVGTATIIGPIPKNEYMFTGFDKRKVGGDEEESKWHCTALYCSPAMRGNGLGKLLVNSRIQFARTQSTTKRVRVRVLVHPTNSKTLEPLRARGFADIGKCCAIEAIPASGDAMLLPADGGASCFVALS